MTELEFAKQRFREYKIKGNEIIPTFCPYCNGGDNRDKNTFALNLETHVFKCLRGSCGKQGSFRRLLRDFGYEDKGIHLEKMKKRYKLPQPQKQRIDDKEKGYINTRGITNDTARAFNVGYNDKGEVVFPFYETEYDFQENKPTFIKYRPAHKVKKGEPKARREKDAKPILFGMHLCKPDNGMLYIFEGEFDCMAGYQAHGGNCVSVPSGCKDFTWIDTCHDFLNEYGEIAIIGDNDEPGKEMIEELSKKLESSVFHPNWELYESCKDTNEILFRHGASRIKEIMDSVKLIPVVGLINIADIVPIDITQIKRTMSGIPSLDKMTGGLYMGDLNVWTGKRGEGKSTLLTQMMLGAVEQGYNVCVYSGEIPAERFQYGLYLQAAGFYVCEKTDEATGKTVSYVPKKYFKQINDWLNYRMWLYDSQVVDSDEGESIIRVFEQAYRRYDCRVFMVDNLMTVQTSKNESDFYQSQADFTIKLRNWAKKLNVCVHLVVHPRKTNGKYVSDNDEVGGRSTITDIACAAFSIRRLSESEAHENGCDSIITCMKNRMYGERGNVQLNFINKSRTFYQPGHPEPRFSWDIDTDEKQDEMEEPPF